MPLVVNSLVTKPPYHWDVQRFFDRKIQIILRKQIIASYCPYLSTKFYVNNAPFNVNCQPRSRPFLTNVRMLRHSSSWLGSTWAISEQQLRLGKEIAEISYEPFFRESVSKKKMNSVPYRHSYFCQVIYEMFHILNCGFEIKEAMIIAVMNAILSNYVEKPEKVRTSTGFEPVTSRHRCVIAY